jgi:hypothetical protein
VIAAIPFTEPEIDLASLPYEIAVMAEDDPVLMLAQAYAWLDPAHFADATPDDYNYVNAAFCITREVWLYQYVDVVRFYHAGGHLEDILENLFAKMLVEVGLEPESLEQVAYEIPLFPVGFGGEDYDYADSEFYHEMTELVGDDSAAWPIAEKIVENLKAQGNQTLEDVSVFVQWLYGLSDNPLFNCDHETFWDGWIHSWSHADYYFANQSEAFALHDRAMEGKRALKTIPELHKTLISNIKKIKRGKYGSITWATNIEYRVSDSSAARHDTQLLRFWRDA